MKTLLILFSLSSSLFAADADRFNAAKTKMLAHIDAQMKILETTKGCISAAADREAIKRCHDAAHAERTKLEKQKIDEDIQKLEDKKKQLEERK